MTALAVLVAGAAFAVAGLALAGVSLRPVVGLATRIWRHQEVVAAAAGLAWLDAGALLLAQGAAATAGAVVALVVSGLPVLAAVGGVLGAAAVRAVVGARAGALRRARQDAAIEAVRTLRQLLETGAVGVQQAMSVLAEKGPPVLRAEFASISAAGGSGRQRQAWVESCARLGEPLFDMLAAAVLVQRPGGGELAPLFARLEESVTAVYEVEREAEALGVQARSAAALILCLPLVFLAVLSMLRSPYLDAYRHFAGQAFLAAMLLVMAASYALILRWLRLPEQPRLRLGAARA